MPCRRCQGLMAEDHSIELHDGGEQLWLHVWRCMNCGDVVDPTILQHRLGLQSPLAALVNQPARTSSRKYAIVRLGH